MTILPKTCPDFAFQGYFPAVHHTNIFDEYSHSHQGRKGGVRKGIDNVWFVAFGTL
jgi:hypothetical protein